MSKKKNKVPPQYWPTITWKFPVGSFPHTNVPLCPTEFDAKTIGLGVGSVYSIAEISINHTTGPSSGLIVRMVDGRGVVFGDKSGECELRIRKALGMSIPPERKYLGGNFYIGITLKRNESFADGAIRIARAIFMAFGVDEEERERRVLPSFEIQYKCMVQSLRGRVDFNDLLRARHGLVLPKPAFVA